MPSDEDEPANVAVIGGGISGLSAAWLREQQGKKVTLYESEATRFIAATHQHVGKTTVALAVLSGLRKRFGDRAGFVDDANDARVI